MRGKEGGNEGDAGRRRILNGEKRRFALSVDCTYFLACPGHLCTPYLKDEERRGDMRAPFVPGIEKIKAAANA